MLRFNNIVDVDLLKNIKYIPTTPVYDLHGISHTLVVRYANLFSIENDIPVNECLPKTCVLLFKELVSSKYVGEITLLINRYDDEEINACLRLFNGKKEITFKFCDMNTLYSYIEMYFMKR